MYAHDDAANPAEPPALQYLKDLEALMNQGSLAEAGRLVIERDDQIRRIAEDRVRAKVTDMLDQLLHLVMAGNRKIEAIKLYREITRVSLKEAKDAVEAMMGGRLATQTADPTRQEPVTKRKTYLVLQREDDQQKSHIGQAWSLVREETETDVPLDPIQLAMTVPMHRWNKDLIVVQVIGRSTLRFEEC